MELARVRVELFEEGDVLLGFPTVVDVREAPAACAKANQLSLVLGPLNSLLGYVPS